MPLYHDLMIYTTLSGSHLTVGYPMDVSIVSDAYKVIKCLFMLVNYFKFGNWKWNPLEHEIKIVVNLLKNRK